MYIIGNAGRGEKNPRKWCFHRVAYASNNSSESNLIYPAYVDTLQTPSNLSLTTTGEVTSQAHSLSVAEQDSNPCYYSMGITKEQYFI